MENLFTNKALLYSKYFLYLRPHLKGFVKVTT